jgi:hypothetical protein
MKKLVTLLVAVAALSIVPAALAGQGNGQAKANGALRGVSIQKMHFGILKHRLRIAARCAKLSASGSTTAGSAKAKRCADLLAKLPDRLQQLDENVQARIAKIQQACPAGSTDQKCDKAPRLLQFLQKLDQRLQDMVAKVQQLQAGTTSG